MIWWFSGHTRATSGLGGGIGGAADSEPMLFNEDSSKDIKSNAADDDDEITQILLRHERKAGGEGSKTAFPGTTPTSAQSSQKRQCVPQLCCNSMLHAFAFQAIVIATTNLTIVIWKMFPTPSWALLAVEIPLVLTIYYPPWGQV